MELRSQGLAGADGKRVTEATVKAACVEFGVLNPTKENLTTHWGKHCERIDGEVAALLDEAVEATLAKLDAGGTVDADAALDRIVGLGMAEVEERIKNGQRSGISPDMVLKAIEAKTRRGQAESQSELLRALGGGISAAFKPLLPQAPVPALGEVVEDAEFSEVAA